MRRFCFAVLAGTAAAVPALFTEAQADANKKFSAVDCSEQMNKEREPMGFPKFTALDTSKPSSAITAVKTTELCASIKAGTDPGIWLTTTEADVTIAAAIQSSETGDCAAATKQWKGALKTVGDSLPPAYAPGKDIYESLDVVSLMSLYTPKDGVAVACTVIQCPQKSPSADGSTSGDSNTNTEPSKPQVPTEPPADGSGGGSSGGNGEGGEEDLEKEKGKGDVSKLQQAEGSAPVTASAVTAGAGGGAAVPSPPPAAARGGVRGGMTIRRLEEVETGTQGEPFNALVCLFTPKTLTKGTAPFQ
ncbi:SAG family member [Eimeria maxima]|uniref:SAG family member n=1 Tax=Eimeria maxima TaxID=5804 RepID=U6M6N2_EIMMA|nr:SAG family member [Eimeria maxima]CDJ58099.1 SAG family member [Eimeria maxima]